MRAEDGHRPRRHLPQRLDEAGALGLQRLDDAAVMDDLMPHIDGSAIFLECPLDDIHRPHDTGAEPPRLRQNNPHQHAP
jgi:hypothetical protein